MSVVACESKGEDAGRSLVWKDGLSSKTYAVAARSEKRILLVFST